MSTKTIGYRPSAQARRDALVSAAIDTIAALGVAGATHRAVAARAGLPPSTTSYFFPSIDALIVEALSSVVDQTIDRLQALRDVLAQQQLSVEDAIDLTVKVATESSARDVLVQFDAYVEAARRAELRPWVRRALKAYEDTTLAVLAAAEVDVPPHAAQCFVALLDGFALRRTALPRSRQDTEALRSGLLALLIGLTSGALPDAAG